MLKENEVVTFKLDKHLSFVKKLGQGGTGEVYLFYDSEVDKYFAIKKFVPPEEFRDEYYTRFTNEVKMLIDIYHQNIVRIYTYYLYPSQKGGYLQMEYIDGVSIDKYISEFPEMFDKIFLSAINAFEYLEQHGILHRDIRPSNFLVVDSQLKVIDFGFGKNTYADDFSTECLQLNWPVSAPPEEIVNNQNYDLACEVYYLGCLFKKLLNNATSKYEHIIEKMCKESKKDRFCSFSEVKNTIFLKNKESTFFDEKQKEIYLNFANDLVKIFVKTYGMVVFRDDDEIVELLKSLVDGNCLEDYISCNNALASCFLKSNFCYWKDKPIKYSSLKMFYEWISNETDERRTIVLTNIKNRISNIKNESDVVDLPF